MKFKVRLYEFSGESLPAHDSDGLSDPFLRLNFDAFKKCDSEVVKDNCDPTWALDVAFTYETRYGHKLKSKSLIVEVYDKNKYTANVFMGSCTVDLLTLATGPVSHELQLWNESKPAGRLKYKCEMEQLADVTVCLSGVLASDLPLVEGAPPTAGLNFFYSGTPSGHPTPPKPSKCQSERKMNNQNPEWTVLERFRIPNVSLKELFTERVEFEIINHKSGRPSGTIGTVSLPFNKYATFVDGTEMKFSEPITLDASISAGSTPPRFEGSISFKDFPVFAQMHGGLHKDNGITDGTPFCSGVTLPPGVSATVERKDPAPSTPRAVSAAVTPSAAGAYASLPPVGAGAGAGAATAAAPTPTAAATTPAPAPAPADAGDAGGFGGGFGGFGGGFGGGLFGEMVVMAEHAPSVHPAVAAPPSPPMQPTPAPAPPPPMKVAPTAPTHHGQSSGSPPAAAASSGAHFVPLSPAATGGGAFAPSPAPYTPSGAPAGFAPGSGYAPTGPTGPTGPTCYAPAPTGPTGPTGPMGYGPAPSHHTGPTGPTAPSPSPAGATGPGFAPGGYATGPAPSPTGPTGPGYATGPSPSSSPTGPTGPGYGPGGATTGPSYATGPTPSPTGPGYGPPATSPTSYPVLSPSGSGGGGYVTGPTASPTGPGYPTSTSYGPPGSGIVVSSAPIVSYPPPSAPPATVVTPTGPGGSYARTGPGNTDAPTPPTPTATFTPTGAGGALVATGPDAGPSPMGGGGFGGGLFGEMVSMATPQVAPGSAGFCVACSKPANYVCKDTKAPVCGAVCKQANLRARGLAPVAAAPPPPPPAPVVYGPPPLPAGWSEGRDPSSGRVYYKDLVNKSTSWERPTGPAVPHHPQPVAYAPAPVHHPHPQQYAPAAAHPPPPPPQPQPYYAYATSPTPAPAPAPASVLHAAPLDFSASALPVGWSEASDPTTGRKYYKNHYTKATTWERPVAPGGAAMGGATGGYTLYDIAAQAGSVGISQGATGGTYTGGYVPHRR